MRKLGFVVLLMAVVIAGAVAHAGEPPATPSMLLKRGIELQREASWSASIATLEKARAAGVLARAEQIECAFYLAAAYVAVGSDGAARRELAFVLEAQPGFEPPPYTSPKVTSLLGELARTRQQGPSLEARPPRSVSGAAAGSGATAGAIKLGFEARRAPGPIFGVVRFRLRGEATWRDALLQSRGADGTLVAEVRPGGSGVLQYHARAMSAAGALSIGSPGAPLELPYHAPASVGVSLAPQPKQARGPSKWVWAAIPLGVVLGVATGLGLYYGLGAR